MLLFFHMARAAFRAASKTEARGCVCNLQSSFWSVLAQSSHFRARFTRSSSSPVSAWDRVPDACRCCWSELARLAKWLVVWFKLLYSLTDPRWYTSWHVLTVSILNVTSCITDAARPSPVIGSIGEIDSECRLV